MSTPCVHERTSKGEVHEYCEDCGAVRMRDSRRPGQWEPWHTCDLCRLPTAKREGTND